MRLNMDFSHLTMTLFWFILLIVFIIIVILGSLLFRQVRWRKHYETEMNRMERMAQEIRPTARIEENLAAVLRILSSMHEAPNYAAYVLDKRSQRYILKATLHPFDKFSNTGPSYSGLAVDSREKYLPPMVLEADATRASVQVIYEGEVPLLSMQTEGKLVLFRIGPVYRVAKPIRMEMRKFLHQYSKLIEDVVALETARLQQEIASLGEDAVKKVARLSTDESSALELIVQSFTGFSGYCGGAFFRAAENEEQAVIAVGALRGLRSRLKQDQELQDMLKTWIEGRPYCFIGRQSQEFYQLPGYLTVSDVGAVLIVQIPQQGILLICFGADLDNKNALRPNESQIQLLVDQMVQISSFSSLHRRLGRSYSYMLWNLSNMVDDFNPYTVGYSEMMARYSLVVGKRMGMTEEELRDLALAAHLSNIGVIGLNMELLSKEGVFNDAEYESIKLHVQIGASMILIASGNERAAQYVLYHHERIDGLGFPEGLKGEDIPLGARIIHVIQVFLAKINGRAWRTPLSFEKALETLQQAAGTQLDGRVVNAFVDWWKERAQMPEVNNRTLAPCYELCCTPKHICQACPVYQSAAPRCWEVGNHLCKAHGRECKTCFVRTEFLYRNKEFVH
ncbi:HD-GYP domain-containing protein [Alicyclobacillus tolerans]|uniref:HD domain-containing protein n=4 Tax=Alicyclobacillus tolerans TaxID=90970 RepID=A0A1M6VSR9_9BACL|nr:HD domain-containing phosphohydrolase [Alicyclobacillus tengchongensis]MDP9727805.1 HD-GYP domain-containing protein (c-di-GMP phosphodiesterase class II) [Alicyclobacillus tengchongensis]SHK84583.1 HD domain-containing protein [Alicyclobacillus montanus]